MKKKYLFYCLFIFSSIILYSQDWTDKVKVERITYVDIGADGLQRIYKTVNAVHCGWEQQEYKIEGNFSVTYHCFSWINNRREWSNWELAERRPMQGTLSFWYDALVKGYMLTPNAGRIITGEDGIKYLRMWSIPKGKADPVWWNKDGKSFFSFFNLYMIVN